MIYKIPPKKKKKNPPLVSYLLFVYLLQNNKRKRGKKPGTNHLNTNERKSKNKNICEEDTEQ